jgi:hypothetical protein
MFLMITVVEGHDPVAASEINCDIHSAIGNVRSTSTPDCRWLVEPMSASAYKARAASLRT